VNSSSPNALWWDPLARAARQMHYGGKRGPDTLARKSYMLDPFDPCVWRVAVCTVFNRTYERRAMATGQRDARLDLRMNSEQKETIGRAAAASGMSVSQWALDRLMMYARLQ